MKRSRLSATLLQRPLFKRFLLALKAFKQSNTARTVLDFCQAQSLLAKETQRIMEGAVRLADLHARDIMIPLQQIISLQLNYEHEQILKIIIDSAHSRFPVFDNEEVIGIVLAKDLLPWLLQSDMETFNLKNILRPAILVPGSKSLNRLLKEFQSHHTHMAIVVDEYGKSTGLVTIEDILEEIVGEIEDEHDTGDHSLFIRTIEEDKKYVVKATTPIDLFNRFFCAQLRADEFDTIGGLVVHAFGYLPIRHESKTVEAYHFRVLNANSRRVLLFEVKIIDKPTPKENIVH